LGKKEEKHCNSKAQINCHTGHDTIGNCTAVNMVLAVPALWCVYVFITHSNVVLLLRIYGLKKAVSE